MNRQLQYSFFASLAFLFLAGCTAGNIKDVAGSYEVKYSYGVEVLTLLPDGTYKQDFTLNSNSTHYQNEGSWDLKDSQITLNDPLMVDNGEGVLAGGFAVPKKNSVWLLPLPTKIPFGETSISINDDLGIYFVKKK